MTFSVPHHIFEGKHGLNKSSRILLVALLALNDKYVLKKEGDRDSSFFNISNPNLCRMVGLSKGTLTKARKYLIDNGWIEFVPGFSGRNSQYSILLDNFIPIRGGKK